MGTGNPGPSGAKGDIGITGIAGTRGDIGPSGSAGLQGLQGPQGTPGNKGDAGGATGAQGPKGDTGLTGLQGSVGLQGSIGPQGSVGPQGPLSSAGVWTAPIYKNDLKIYFSNKWQDTANNDTSEISNDTSDFKELMVIGNKSGGGNSRRVGIWDVLNVHGDLNVEKTSTLGIANIGTFNATSLATFKAGMNIAGDINQSSGIANFKGDGINVDKLANIGGLATFKAGVNITGDVTQSGGVANFNSLNVNGVSNFKGDSINVDNTANINKLNVNNIRLIQGIGPYMINFYNSDDGQCLDANAMNGNGNGGWKCDSKNDNQKFTYNPVTGFVKQVSSDLCLDAVTGGKWKFNQCNNHQNQRFNRLEDQLRSRNEDCLDIGNQNHHAGCDGSNKNQKMKFDLV